MRDDDTLKPFKFEIVTGDDGLVGHYASAKLVSGEAILRKVEPMTSVASRDEAFCSWWGQVALVSLPKTEEAPQQPAEEVHSDDRFKGMSFDGVALARMLEDALEASGGKLTVHFTSGRSITYTGVTIVKGESTGEAEPGELSNPDDLAVEEQEVYFEPVVIPPGYYDCTEVGDGGDE